MDDLTLDAHKLSRSITLKVRVRGVRTMVVRWWLCAQVLRLAAFIGGFAMVVEIVE